MYYKYDRIEFENNLAYVVVDIVIYKDETYLYLISDDNEGRVVLLKEEKENNEVFFKTPTHEEMEIVMEEIVKKNKGEIEKLLMEESINTGN